MQTITKRHNRRSKQWDVRVTSRGRVTLFSHQGYERKGKLDRMVRTLITDIQAGRFKIVEVNV